jgi:DNA ligase-4
MKPSKHGFSLFTHRDPLIHILNFSAGEPQWSILASSAEEVQKFFQETVDNRDEGVILKDLDSKWEPSDRSTKWLKLKPDYIHSESDLDVLIIGGYYGSGGRGGEVSS